MLSMVGLIPVVFVFLIWRSYRTERVRAAAGEGFAPVGKLRWSGSPTSDSGISRQP